ncbi:MAG: hypothetical protein SOR65_00395 [Odoribacter sp.]|nr:hypothetical protein [Odoribacter sp.]
MALTTRRVRSGSWLTAFINCSISSGSIEGAISSIASYLICSISEVMIWF